MNVANCRSCIDPAAGDQSGSEYRIQPFFVMPWSCVLRHPDERVSHLVSDYARHAAMNDYIGYNQSNRLSMWYNLQVVKDYDPANIKVACDSDCSSSTAAIVKAVGYKLGDERLKSVSEGLTTFYMRSAFEGVGFQVLTGSICYQESMLQPGDVLLNDECHVTIAVADTDFGSASDDGSIKTGDIVRINSNAMYYGEDLHIPSWILSENWIVHSVDGEKAVLNKSQDGRMAIMSPFHVSDLTKADKSEQTTPVTETENNQDVNDKQTYTVKSGDCLYTIAQQMYGDGNRYPEIAQANNLSNPDYIFPGQVLIIP